MEGIMTVHLIVKSIKKTLNEIFFSMKFFWMQFPHYKWVNTFLNGLEILEEILTLKLIFPTTWQKLILKM